MKVRNSLVFQMMEITFSIYIFITVILTGTHMYSEWKRTGDLVYSELSTIGKSSEAGIALALWDINHDQVLGIVNGLLVTPVVTGIRIEENDYKKTFGTPGNIIFQTQMQLEEYGEMRSVGEIYIYSDSSIVFHRVKGSFILIIINAIIKTIALWVIILLVGKKVITLPLSKLTRLNESIDLENLEEHKNVSIRTYQRSNELKILETSFNKMIEKLLSTRQKLQENEKQLKKYQEELEIKVENRTKELSEEIQERKQLELKLRLAKDNAEAATNAKSDFLANMSHEIRTPMNAIMGLTHLALVTELNPQQDDYLNKIQTSANNLLGIINDILDFSKIEAGKLDMESVDFNLDQVLQNVSNLISGKSQKKELEFLIQSDLNLPRYLIGDPLRLGQILINLANNAVKFTEKGEVVILANLVKLGKDQVTLQFTVKDTGIGLSKVQIDKLFQAFSQADASTTRKFGGTGLGLVICKKLVNMMNGRIWVESESGKGSSFIFEVEFGLQKVIEEPTVGLAEDMKDLKVLIVDDNETSRQIFSEILTSFSFNVEVAYTGGKAIDALTSTKTPFDLVIMDWKMPGMDGLETSYQIKNHIALPKIPKIIMCSGYGREHIMNQAEEIGLDAFLIKPVNPSILLDTILHVFGKTTREGSPITQNKPELERELNRIQGANLLLVEDNEINQQVALEILESVGFFVTIADNGQIGVDTVNNGIYDLVLMDIQMPVMDGYAATELIRKKYSFEKLPIVAMTANAMVGDKERALDVGMNDHVAKPIDPAQLYKTLVKWIEPGDRKLPERFQDENKKSVKNLKIPKSIRGIDTRNGLNRVGGNQKLYRDHLIEFHREYQDIAEQILKALDKHDNELAQRLAHTVKGVAGKIGANRIQTAAATIELHIKNQQLKNIEELLRTLAEELAAPMEDLQAIADQAEKTVHDERKPEKIPPAKIEELDLPGIDIKTGLSRMNQNVELYFKVLRKFKENQARTPQEMRVAIDSNDWEKALRMAHTLKGLAGSIGATTLQELSTKLENACNGKTNTQKIDRLLQETEKNLKEVIDGLHILDKQVSPTKPISVENLLELLKNLRELLEDDDTEAITVFDKLESRLTGTSYTLQLEKVGTFVGDYDFEDALEALKILEGELKREGL